MLSLGVVSFPWGPQGHVHSSQAKPAYMQLGLTISEAETGGGAKCVSVQPGPGKRAF